MGQHLENQAVETLQPQETLGWNSELVEAIYGLLHRSDLRQSDLSSELRQLEVTHGNELYSELIFVLSHPRLMRLKPGNTGSGSHPIARRCINASDHRSISASL
jgi:hypothetical protein